MFPSNGRDWDNGEFSGLCGLCAEEYVSWSCRTAAKSLEQKKEKTRRETRGETSPGTRAGTSKKQEIMMEQPHFLSKERRNKKGDKKGDKPRNQSRNQEEPENHDGTKTVSSKN